MKKHIYSVTGLLLGTLLLACTQDDYYIPEGISGTLTILEGTEMDSDTNDPNANYQSNNSIAQAQAISNPVQLGGYVNASTDPNDYFSVQLAQSQKITLSGIDLVSVLSIRLLDASEVVIATDTSASLNPTPHITVPTSGNYYINVQAVSGTSNYILSVDLEASTQISSSSFGAAQTSPRNEFVPGDIIVEFNNFTNINTNLGSKPSADPGIKLANQLSLSIQAGSSRRSLLMRLGNKSERVATLTALKILRKTSSSDDLEQLKQDTLAVVQELQQRPEVKSARLNYIRKALFIPNDTLYINQWHYPLINLPQAWDVSRLQSNNTIVAVIDNGIQPGHPDFINQLVAGYDFIDMDPIPTDPINVNPNHTYHGTHVAGTVAAASDNGQGVTGVAGFNARIMSLRVLDSDGYGNDYNVEQGVRYAAGLSNDAESEAQTIARRDIGLVADVINLSLGGPAGASVTPSAYTEARAAGVIIVAAAGNDRSSAPFYPAAHDGVVSVSAVDTNKISSPYSNYGASVDVAAPGGNMRANLNNDELPDGIFSTYIDTSGNPVYQSLQGTSMASPHVAGVAAIMKSLHKSLSPAEFDTALAAGAISEDIGAVGWDKLYGHGLIDACKAAVYAARLEGRTDIPSITSRLTVAPGILNIPHNANHTDFSIARGCGTTPITVAGLASSETWLTITPISVDADGLGIYRASINRSMLPVDSTTPAGVINISTATATTAVPTIVQLAPSPRYAGYHYIVLFDALTDTNVQQIEVDSRVGKFDFRFSNVPSGLYYIISTSDMDNDGSICDNEVCGDFPYYISFPKDSRIGGVNFIAGFDTVVTNSNQASVQRLFRQ